jgi:hypothetical protein
LKSSSNCRRARRLLVVSAIGLDIVSTFRKMSTKPDQAQTDPSTAAPTARDEVEDLDPAIACDEDIRPPQNLVDDALLVGRGKPSGDADADFERAAPGYWFAGDRSIQ